VSGSNKRVGEEGKSKPVAKPKGAESGGLVLLVPASISHCINLNDFWADFVVHFVAAARFQSEFQ